VDDLGLVGTEDAERADVTRCLDEYDVSRIAEHPHHEVECNATAPFSRMRRRTVSAICSMGSALTNGMPPARLTTSGREATANNDRISLTVMEDVRAA
jgi:hypothetical protein